MTFINICFTDRAFYCLLRLSLTSRRLERIYKYEVSRFRIAAFLLSCFAASRCRCVTPSKQKNFKLANPELRTSFRCLTVLLRETNEQKNLLEAVAKSETWKNIQIRSQETSYSSLPFALFRCLAVSLRETIEANALWETIQAKELRTGEPRIKNFLPLPRLFRREKPMKQTPRETIEAAVQKKICVVK